MPSDTLYIYDGPDDTYPLIGAYNNNSVPQLYLMPINASIYNPTGCLTVHFVSDGSLQSTGWAASISCEPLCQQVIAKLDLSVTSPTPDTNYIAICPGESITFAGSAEFPQNNYIYNQSLAGCSYEWHFGDGTTANGQVVNHTYPVAGGYNISLFVTDGNGCISKNSIDTRVIISGNPFNTINNPQDICVNDTLDLLFSYNNDPTTTILGEPYHVVIDASLGVSDTTFLPDGTGVTYTTGVTFNCFAPGQTLHNAWDIVSICTNMEHSFLGDLEIKLVCPNGQFIILKEYPGGGGTFLGVPIDIETDLNPGEGYEYCWSPTPTMGTMVAESASYGTLPAGEYAPFQSFAALVGCPLNGQWSIEVSDNWALDNGFIFSWELTLDPSISPNNWEYTVPISQMSWTNGPFIISENPNSISVNPTASGIYEYTYTIVDAVGCVWDTSAFLTVISAPVVDLGNDVLFCNPANTVTLDAGNPGFNYTWNNASNSQTLVAGSSGIYSVTVSNGLCSDIDSISVYYGEMEAQTIPENVSCYSASDGSVNLVPVGNSPPFTFLWINSATSEDLNNLPAGNYSVTITDVNGCSIEISTIIESPDQISVSATQDHWICIGETTTLSAAATGGTPGYSYEWCHGVSSASIDVSPVVSTQYCVKVIDSKGCESGLKYVNVFVYEPVSIEISANKYEICSGDPVILSAIATGGNGNYTYTLQNNGNEIVPPYTIYPTGDISYSIIAADNCGSPTDIASVNIVVNPLPPVNFIPDTTNGCEPLTVNFAEINQDESQTYNWNFGDINSFNTSEIKVPKHIFEQDGVYSVSLTVTSAKGCKNSKTIADLITVYPIPSAKFISNPEVVSIVKPIVYFENLTTGAVNYHWMFGDGDSSLNFSPYHQYAPSVGTYNIELRVESEFGCRDTIYNTIIVRDEYTFYAPSAFSPDNDLNNDEFFVTGHGIDENNFKLLIYDRWGETIFETSDINEHWDGKVKGGTEICKTGIYTWMAIFKDIYGIEHNESGPVTIIK